VIHSDYTLVDVAHVVFCVVLSIGTIVPGFLSAVFGWFWYKGCFK
jgi:hypothetical protein